MPLSKARMRELKRRTRRLGIQSIMSSADVRAMRIAGIDPEYIENEAGKVSSRVYYALLRDRDAVKAHLSWLQESEGFNARKAQTLETMKRMKAGEACIK